MLRLEEISVRYGGLAALIDVSLEVNAGELISVIGPNGAGKTTLFKAISGTVPLAHGRILLDGRDLASVPAAARPHLGIAHVPENRQVFGRLSIIENLELGTTALHAKADRKRNIDYVMELFPFLRQRMQQPAGTLSGGEQQMLVIGRGLVSSPRLLLLDEPSMGLAPVIVTQIFERIERIHRDMGLTIILVEQRAVEALEACDRAYVLSTGRVVTAGAKDQLFRDKAVKAAYLGGLEAGPAGV